jgi:hypothetical protein
MKDVKEIIIAKEPSEKMIITIKFYEAKFLKRDKCLRKNIISHSWYLLKWLIYSTEISPHIPLARINFVN